MTVKTVRVPGEDYRLLVLTDSNILVTFDPGHEGVALAPPLVHLEARAEGMPHSQCCHGNRLALTRAGWREFIAAVKAGEFDELLP